MAFTEYSSKPTIFIPGPKELFRALRKLAKRRQKHNEVAKLLDQEDWVLMDMGISRGDVREALAFRGDASLHLRALAARRRFWSHQHDKT